uniref:Cytochrome c oxidase subunit II n=1 Tax=Rhizophora mucronata TaxID=61149 RepID=A0A2P2MME3_RHIMU
MPLTRALLATNHSLAVRSGSAFQVRYPNRLLCSTGSLAPSSILDIALLLGSLQLQPLAVIACFSGGSHRGWCG